MLSLIVWPFLFLLMYRILIHQIFFLALETSKACFEENYMVFESYCVKDWALATLIKKVTSLVILTILKVTGHFSRQLHPVV